MNLNDYQNRAESTAIYPGRHTIEGLVYCALGLGEAGEVQNKVKKILRDEGRGLTESPFNLPPGVKKAIRAELGGLLWYIALMAEELGDSLELIAQENLYTLKSRQARGVLGGSGDDR
jgi:NTP pyrophosphatase (non-canonical NTP hydrolase)